MIDSMTTTRAHLDEFGARWCQAKEEFRCPILIDIRVGVDLEEGMEESGVEKDGAALSG